MDPEDWIVVAFLFVVDGIKKFKYVIVATVIALVLLIWIVSITKQAEQECRDKGGVPVSSDDGVTCTSGLIK